MCGAQSRHEKLFESQVEIGGARQVEYKLTMEVLSDDALGSFGDAAYQWNRLSSPEDDESRAFRIVFKLRKIK